MGSSFGFTIPFTVVERNGPKKQVSSAPSSFRRLSLPSMQDLRKKSGSFNIPSLSARMLPGWNSSSQVPDDHLDSDGQRFSSNTSVEGPAMTLEIGLTPSRSRVSENSLSATDLVPPEVGVIVNGSSYAQHESSSFSQSHYSFASERRGSQSDGLLVTNWDSACSDIAVCGNASASSSGLPRNNGGTSSNSNCDARSSIFKRDTSTPNSRIGSPYAECLSQSPPDKGPSPLDRGLVFLLVDGTPSAVHHLIPSLLSFPLFFYSVTFHLSL